MQSVKQINKLEFTLLKMWDHNGEFIKMSLCNGQSLTNSTKDAESADKTERSFTSDE